MKITKSQLKRIIKEEFEQIEQEQEFSEEPLSAPTPPAEEVAKKILDLPAEALSLIWDFITGGGRSDIGPSGDEGRSGHEPKPYMGTDDPSMGTRYGESIDRDKLTTHVAEEVRKILKTKK